MWNPYNDSVDMLDILAVTGLEWLYDIVENRYGRVAALLVTWGAALLLIGLILWFLVRLIAR